MPQDLAVSEVIGRLRSGDRRTLARTISALERGADSAGELLAAIRTASHSSAWTTGITGPPGAGKSTLADQLVSLLREQGHTVAICAVDPTSPETGGSILGDRVRLRADHVADDGVYLRSVAAKGSLGGLSDLIPSAVAAIEFAGWQEIILETVGVGQSEVAVARQADTTVVVVTPESGDDIQASKAGLLEVADIVVINKADRPGAVAMAANLHSALSGNHAGWNVPVLQVVAAEGEGVLELMASIEEHRTYLEESGGRRERQQRRRREEVRRLLRSELEQRIDRLLNSPRGRELLRELDDGTADPAAVATELLALS